MNKVIDCYTLELEALSEHENAPQPVRCIATNTDDKSAAEAWLTREKARVLLKMLYGYDEHVDGWMQQLADHHYADLIAQQRGTKFDRCVLNSTELLPYGFRHEHLRPRKRDA
jgi:hypothetical protein